VGSVARRDTLKVSRKNLSEREKVVRTAVRTELEKSAEREKRCWAETESFPRGNNKGQNFPKTFQKVEIFTGVRGEVCPMSQHFVEISKSERTETPNGRTENTSRQLAQVISSGQ
jgi:hypothetical protein